MSQKKKRTLYILLSLAVTVSLIGLLLSRIKIQDLIETLRSISFSFLGLFMAIALLASVLRSWRYQMLLKPQSIKFGDIFCVTLIRNVFVDLLPARIGSLSYVYLMNRRLSYTFETSASTFLMSVLYDFLTLSPFLAASILIVGLGRTSVSSLAMLVSALVFLLAFGLLFMKLPEFIKFLILLYKKVLTRLGLTGRPWARISLVKIELTIESLRSIQKRGGYGPIFAVSMAIRLAKYMSLYFLLAALLRGHGFSLQNLNFFKTILGITGAELTSVLPIKGLGGFGTWESAWALTFQLMKFDSKIAIISGIGVHLITNIFEYILGVLAILLLAFPILRAGKTKEPNV